MNIFFIGLIVLVVGAVVGGLIEYLLGLVLPEKPQEKNIIAVIITIIALAGFVVWISAKGEEPKPVEPGAYFPTVSISVSPMPPSTSTSSALPTLTRTPEANDEIETSPSPIPKVTVIPTNTAQPKLTATPKPMYSTNNPGKWLLPLIEEGYILEDSGTRNNLEASQEFQRVDRAEIYELFEQSGRITSAYEEVLVDCNYLAALVTVSQEVMTFSTKKGAESIFDYWRNHITELFDTGYLYANSEINYKKDDSPGNQNFLVSAPRTFEYCGQQLELFQATTVFQRGNTIGVITAIGRDEPNTRIMNFFYALDLDLNILANP